MKSRLSVALLSVGLLVACVVVLSAPRAAGGGPAALDEPTAMTSGSGYTVTVRNETERNCMVTMWVSKFAVVQWATKPLSAKGTIVFETKGYCPVALTGTIQLYDGKLHTLQGVCIRTSSPVDDPTVGCPEIPVCGSSTWGVRYSRGSESDDNSHTFIKQ
jgi:hypothetical protein